MTTDMVSVVAVRNVVGPILVGPPVIDDESCSMGLPTRDASLAIPGPIAAGAATRFAGWTDPGLFSVGATLRFLVASSSALSLISLSDIAIDQRQTFALTITASFSSLCSFSFAIAAILSSLSFRLLSCSALNRFFSSNSAIFALRSSSALRFAASCLRCSA